MSTYYIQKKGINNVPSYQISGIPFLTASLIAPTGSVPLRISFPSVTKAIHVHNHDASESLRIGFSANGVFDGKYWIVDEENASGKGQCYYTFPVKVDGIFLLSNTSTPVSGVMIFAELTGLEPEFDLLASYSGAAGIG